MGGLNCSFRWVGAWGVMSGRSLKLTFMEFKVGARDFAYIISLNHVFLKIALSMVIKYYNDGVLLFFLFHRRRKWGSEMLSKFPTLQSL